MNHVVLVGRLVADPETRYTQSGIALCTFRLAVDRKFKNAQGEKEADFISCVAWRKAAELIGQYMSKGRRLGVEGSLQSRNYQDKDGNNRTAYEVQVDEFEFLDSGRGGGGQQPPPPPPPGSGQGSSSTQEPYGGSAPEPPPENPMDDDLPF